MATGETTISGLTAAAAVPAADNVFAGDDVSLGDTLKYTAAEIIGRFTQGHEPMAAALDMGGFAITNVGTVDGRDVSADGAKLDGIEAGAEVNAVDSVFGRVGAVVAQAGDYAASLISNDSGVAGSTVKAALDNLDLQNVYDHDPAVTLVDGTPIALTHNSPTADSLSILDSVGGQDIGLRPTGVFYGGPATADFVITGEVPSTVGADGRAGVWTGAPGADGDGGTAAGAGGPIQIIAGAQGANGGGGAGEPGDLDLRSGGLSTQAAGDVFLGGSAVGTEGSLQTGGANVHIWTGNPGVAVTDIADEGSIFVGAAHDVYITAGTNMLNPPADAFVRMAATGELQLSSTTAGIVRVEDADLVFGTADTERIVRNGDSFEFYTNNQLTLTLRRQVDASTQNEGMVLSPTVNLGGTNFYDGARIDVTETATGDGTDDPDGIGSTVHRWRVDSGSGLETVAAVDSAGTLHVAASGTTGAQMIHLGDGDSYIGVSGGQAVRITHRLGFRYDFDGAGFRIGNTGLTFGWTSDDAEFGTDGFNQPTLLTGSTPLLRGLTDPVTPADGDTNLAIREHQDPGGGVTAALSDVSLGDMTIDGQRVLTVPNRASAAMPIVVSASGNTAIQGRLDFEAGRIALDQVGGSIGHIAMFSVADNGPVPTHLHTDTTQTGGAAVNFAPVPIDSGYTYWLEAHVTAGNAATGDTAAFVVRVRAWDSGGGAAIGTVESTWTDVATGLSVTCTFVVDGASVALQVNDDEGGSTITWAAEVRYQRVQHI